MHKKSAFILSFIAILSLFQLHPAEARHYQDFEGEVPHWSEYGVGSETRQKINALPAEPVQNLPIPILFGVTVGDLTQNFGDPRGDGTRTHEGLDILAPNGTPIVSPTDAVVTRAGDGSSSGLYVYTANPGGEVFAYMHLSQIGEHITEGVSLKRGDLIGYVGNTGNASGGAAHLHFEIRKNGATDPYPRLTEVFSLSEKVEFLNKIINITSNPENFAQFLVQEFQSELRSAEAEGSSLPQNILTVLNNTPTTINTEISSSPVPVQLVNGVISSDMEAGDEGEHVVWLQRFLIEKDTGEAARYLARSGATGYFGSITERALIEFQKANGITPAAGYYGAITRAFIAKYNGAENNQTSPQTVVSFTRNLTIGMRGEDVRNLQVFLNTKGMLITENGAGSPGNETDYFGVLTQKALAKYQEANGITPAVGYFGPITRAYVVES